MRPRVCSRARRNTEGTLRTDGTTLPVMSARAIEVRELVKSFDVPVREPGLTAALRSLVHRKTRTVTAVGGVDFAIDGGEVVGFLGPNGAGKTTTLKMLSGLLHPTSGDVTVLGHEPFRRERDYLRQITLVMGNRNQLQWDLPALDSFELSRAIYRIPRPAFLQQRDELIELLDIAGLVDKPVRNLSLGERMKAEFASSLLHRPRCSSSTNRRSASTSRCRSGSARSWPSTTADTARPCS